MSDGLLLGALVLMALGIGFAVGAAWMWHIVNRAFDEYERNHR